jgi:hypothetical protein
MSRKYIILIYYIMHLSKFIQSDTGRHIMSAILGFGLATLFRVACADRNCVIFKAPNMSEIDDKTFKHGDKCYKFSHETRQCSNNAESVTY